MDATPVSRIALVHDWLTGMRGGEKCLEALCRRWPDANLFTLLHAPGRVSPEIERLTIHTSFLQRLPGVAGYYRFLLPLMPLAVESFRLVHCDLVLSLSHCVAKAVRPPHGVPHVCYCFTPMRYLWHMRAAYFPTHRGLKAVARDWLLNRLQRWDRETAERVTHFIAISDTVRVRIQECYGRASVVIFPPVDTEFYTPAKLRRDDYYLVVSAFAPYKRIDQAIEACNRLKRRLVIVGTGQDEKRLRKLAGHTVQFAGWQGNAEIRDHLRRCRALLFPGEEDFGIVPVEANACGAPVIAYGQGGATETLIARGGLKSPTGILYQSQTVEGLVEAMEQFERHESEFSPEVCRGQALRFRRQRFEEEIGAFLENVISRRTADRRMAA
jgi:glycosyltransferase involved in cell wall biosynthesis